MYPKRPFVPSPVILLILLVSLIFIVPFFPKSSTPSLYQVIFTLIILAAAFTQDRDRKFNLIIAGVIIAAKWGIMLYDHTYRNISNIPTVIFFIWMVGKILWRIANAPKKSPMAIIDCINGYFLMALVSAIIIGITSYFSPGSFNFSEPGAIPIQGMNEYIYHALVVFSTTGFGDIVPITPQAKAVSNFISVSGQLYVAIIISLLIGNYSTVLQASDNRKKESQ